MHFRAELYVGNLQTSIQFYTQLLDFKVVQDDGVYVAMQNRSTTLSLFLISSTEYCNTFHGKDDLPKGHGVELIFEVDDVNAYYDRFAGQAYPLEQGLVTRSWGSRDFRVYDPDGYYLRITSSQQIISAS
jgi:lactoylglutathione lyase